MSNKLKEIKRICADHPVTDPRGALLAIDAVLSRKNPEKKIKPVLTVSVFDHGNYGYVSLLGDKNKVEPKHLTAAIDTLQSLATKMLVGEEPPVPATNKTIVELFEQFEEEARRAAK